MLDSSGAIQVAFVEYSYDLSPDFSSLRVVAKLEFANKTGPAAAQKKPELRVSRKNLAYAQQITSIVSLPTPSEDITANASRWSAGGGKAARQALTTAFGEIEKLLPRTLALTAEDVKAMSGKDRPKGKAGGFAGRVQETKGLERCCGPEASFKHRRFPESRGDHVIAPATAVLARLCLGSGGQSCCFLACFG